ncbi:MAG: hypothetical protein ACP5NL_00710 [Thermoplasmata archaeon]
MINQQNQMPDNPQPYQQPQPMPNAYYPPRASISETLSKDNMIAILTILSVFLMWLGYLLEIVGAIPSNTGATNDTIISSGAIIFELGAFMLVLMLILVGLLRFIFPAWQKHEADRWVRVFLILAGLVIVVIAFSFITSFGTLSALLHI